MSDYPPGMLLTRLANSLQSRPGAEVRLNVPSREAVVAVIFRPNLDLLFIKRAEFEGDPWSGHMALPGGGVEPSDADIESAVRREVAEEVGIDLSGATMLGRLDQVASPVMTPRVIVTPFVFQLAGDPAVRLDTREVAAVHWFSLDRLLSDEGRGTFQYEFFGRTLELPRIDLDGERVWGMTLRIVDDILARLRMET